MASAQGDRGPKAQGRGGAEGAHVVPWPMSREETTGRERRSWPRTGPWESLHPPLTIHTGDDP